MKPRDKIPADSNDEASLFRDAVRDVEPIPSDDKAIHSRKLPRPTIRRSISIPDSSFTNHNPISEMEPGDEHSFLRSGVSRKTLKQLRRGHWNTDDQLDLHGFTRDEALRELDEFLDTCSMRGFRCVQIIHGKGLNSKNREPVLKTLVWSQLKLHSYVLAFCQAGPADGGSGAVLVLFKSSVTKRAR
jgi:DNA-nicking Smr family endonuclease